MRRSISCVGSRGRLSDIAGWKLLKAWRRARWECVGKSPRTILQGGRSIPEKELAGRVAQLRCPDPGGADYHRRSRLRLSFE